MTSDAQVLMTESGDQGGQILVSSLLKALVESSGEFEFGECRDVELKGLAGLHQLHAVVWDAGRAADP